MPAPFPRRQLRDAAPLLLSAELRDRAARAAAALPFDLPARFVAFDVRRNPAALAPAIDWLLTQGYSIVRIGHTEDAMPGRGVLDVPSSGIEVDLLQRFIVEKARFVVCDSGERQHTASRINTPTLRLNARDPFSAYPVRGNGLFTLGAAVDLDSGRVLSPRELLSESYLRHGRHFALRPNRPAQVLAAVKEMHEGVTAGWREDADQMRVRELVTDAGLLLASRIPLVAEWGPDDGFIGDGRLARWQAGEL